MQNKKGRTITFRVDDEVVEGCRKCYFIQIGQIWPIGC